MPFRAASVSLIPSANCSNVLFRTKVFADIAIKYEELVHSQQMAIFKSFLEQLNRKRLVYDYDDLLEWVHRETRKLAFNDRQIRNVVSTAMGIALVDEANGGKLKRSHLIRVVEQTKQFKQDLIAEEELYKRLQKGIS